LFLGCSERRRETKRLHLLALEQDKQEQQQQGQLPPSSAGCFVDDGSGVGC